MVPVRSSRPALVIAAAAAWLWLAPAGRAEEKSPPSHEESQIWADVIYTKPVSGTVDLHVTGTLKLGQGLGHFVNERVGTGYSYRVNRHLSVSQYYSFIASQPYAGREVREHRTIFDAILQWTLRDFSFSDRNRFERRFIYDSRDSTRYRNSLQVEHPVESGRLGLRAFAYDEIQWESSYHAWNRNRFAAGLRRKFSPQATIDLYYLRQNDGFSRPGDIHAICTTIRLRS